MKVDSVPVETNGKTSNARLVMTSIYATMLSVASAVMIKSAPVAAHMFEAHPVATAMVVSAAIVGALKFINKSLDSIIAAEDLEILQEAQQKERKEQARMDAIASLSPKAEKCSSADDIQAEMERLKNSGSVAPKSTSLKGL